MADPARPNRPTDSDARGERLGQKGDESVATPEEREAAPTVAQLKHGIDRGEAADKVAYPDPGASPLGTDDEAAGNPVEPERVAMSQRAEARAEPASSRPLQSAPRAGGSETEPPRVETTPLFRYAVFGAAALIVLATVLIVVWR